MAGAGNVERQRRERRWRELMSAGQAGDQIAYAQLLREMLPLLRHVAARNWLDGEEIEDVVQDILISLHSVRHTYDPSRAFMPWLMTIARRRVADAARKRASRHAHETTVNVMPETFAGATTNVEQHSVEVADELLHAISLLPQAQQEAVNLVKVRGLSLKEASDQTGRSVTALKVSVHRALKSMRKILDR